MKAKTLLLSLLGVGAPMSGCEGEPEEQLPELSEHGMYVSMGIEGEASPCGGTLVWMDRHVEALGVLFERSVADVSIEYYWLRQASVDELCGLDAYACALPGGVYSSGPLVEHEFVHAVVNGWTGPGERFFDEGLAVALGDHIFGPYVAEEFDEALSMIGADRKLEIDYPTAGAFVTDLIEVHGASAVLAFYDGTDRNDSGEAIAELFEQAFGSSLEAAHQAFLARGRGCTMLLPACSLPPVAWDVDAWAVDAGVSCSVDGLGPDAGPETLGGTPWGFTSFEISSAGSYRLELDGPAYPMFAHHCGPCAERAPSVAFGVPGEAEPVELAAGRYVVRLPGSPSYDRVYPLRVVPEG
ncbi:hypothetical protein [Enhygromyxa salina]|uniref:hypothetical protein n=1 Tax=Enhygromyxa salina TaxID=215803 RepID=UPI000D0977E9|nr:hypothetical protein [Enhygromyxa salina]